MDDCERRERVVDDIRCNEWATVLIMLDRCNNDGGVVEYYGTSVVNEPSSRSIANHIHYF